MKTKLGYWDFLSEESVQTLESLYKLDFKVIWSSTMLLNMDKHSSILISQ